MARPLIEKARRIEKRNWKSIRGLLSRITSLETTAAGHLDGKLDRCRVFNNANLSILHNTPTWLTFNSEQFDLNSMHSLISNTGRITIPTTGGYLFGLCMLWAAGIHDRLIEVFINRSTLILRSQLYGDAVVTPNISHVDCGLYYFTAGQYIEVKAFQTSGGALNILASGNASPYFWAMRAD